MNGGLFTLTCAPRMSEVGWVVNGAIAPLPDQFPGIPVYSAPSTIIKLSTVGRNEDHIDRGSSPHIRNWNCVGSGGVQTKTNVEYAVHDGASDDYMDLLHQFDAMEITIHNDKQALSDLHDEFRHAGGLPGWIRSRQSGFLRSRDHSPQHHSERQT